MYDSYVDTALPWVLDRYLLCQRSGVLIQEVPDSHKICQYQSHPHSHDKLQDQDCLQGLPGRKTSLLSVFQVSEVMIQEGVLMVAQ